MRLFREMRSLWVGCGAAFGFTLLTVALGSVPSASRVTQDGQLYENLKEIRAQKIRDLNYDGDLERLSKLEGRYRERLPKLSSDSRLKGPLSRISAKASQYRPYAATSSVSQ